MMHTSRMARAAFLAALVASPVLAIEKSAIVDRAHHSGGNYPFNGGYGDNDYNDNDSAYLGSFDISSGISWEDAINYRTIHGILASVAIVAIMPIGSIFMRLVPGRFAIWIHAITQVVGYLLFAAGAALGIFLVTKMQIPFAGSLLNSASTNAHPIMGIVVLATLFFQPILGYIHHVRFKRLGRRTIWSHAHLWNGRLSIILGMITGGLGLQLAGAPSAYKIAYGVVAGVLGCAWLAMAIWSELRRRRNNKKNTGDAATEPLRVKSVRPSRSLSSHRAKVSSDSSRHSVKYA